MIAGPENDKFARERERMVEHDLKGRDITEPAVLSVMGRPVARGVCAGIVQVAGIRGLSAADWDGADDFAAVYRGAYDAGASAESFLRGSGDRHGQRVSDGHIGETGETGLHDRAFCGIVGVGAGGFGPAGI